MAEKLDLKKRYKDLYSAKIEPSLVEVPSLPVFAVDGTGDPRNEGLFQARVELLYAASYALKFAVKKARGLDWGVMPNEGDWWCEDMSTWSLEKRDNWRWRLMIVQPTGLSEAEIQAAIEATRAKKKGNPALESLRWEIRPAHRAAHILHQGPYSAEPPTIARLHAFIDREGLRKAGEHREIYLGDPRKVDPAKLKTIIRQPVES
jgi:hypothetical protein